MIARTAKRCRRRLPAFGLLALVACASAPPRHQLEPLSPEQQQLCVLVEKAYRSEAPDYPALRERAAKDALVSAWLTRMFVRDIFAAREQRPVGRDEALLRAVGRIADPVEARAIAELKQLGALAVPTLVGDLLEHDQPQPRELGVELLGYVGPPALPALVEVAERGSPRQQRAAARALGAIGVDERSLPVLRRLANDADFAVRADALRALRSGGPPARALLLDRLRHDPDPFVTRVAALSLGAFPDRLVGEALITYLERCKGNIDSRGVEAAQQALQQVTGTTQVRSAEAWRGAVAALPAGVAATGR
jgi:hypothetical protein